MRLLLRLFGLAFAIAVLFVGWMAYFALSPLLLNTAVIDFAIQPGSSLRSASRQIAQAGVPIADWQFTLLSRVLGKATDIKAGSYEIKDGITPLQLIEKIGKGDIAQTEILLLEGWTFRQFRAALDAHPDIRHDTKGLSDTEVMEKLGFEGLPEGRFFPDTYLFAKNSSDLDILRRSYRQMEKILSDAWARRSENLPYNSPYEALILASIVEKETGKASERKQIASVFVNRLKRGMLLQTDPTVIYGLGELFDGNLRKRDLLSDGSYNTYTRSGLPPSPIAMPGMASIEAVMHPAKTDLLYFVARGDGSSQFSRTLDEHNRAVAKYQLQKGN